MLLELNIGDSYGAKFEFKPKDFVEKYNNPTKLHCIPKRVGFSDNLTYTDDGQLSIAISELIISNKPWTPLNIATHFLNAFKRDPRPGYSKRLHQFLTECKTAEEFLEKIDPISDRSGSAMRSVPLGLVASEQEVIEKATIQAEITHKTQAGVDASIAVGLMCFYLRKNLGPKKNIPNYLNKFMPEWEWDKLWTETVPNLGIPCVKAALTTIITCHTLLDVLKTSIDFTGDTDTIASIAMGCASQSKEMIKNIPISLLENLEEGKYGKSYIKKLDSLLVKQATPLFS